MRFPHIAISLVVSAFVLTGCSSAPTSPNEPVSAPETTESAPTESTPAEPAADGLFRIDHITSCDQVAATVAPYIEGLVLQPSSTVDEWGVSCTWDMAEGETDWANNRSIDVSLTQFEEAETAPDPSYVTSLEGGAIHEDPWLTANGGVATSVTMGVSVAGAVAISVWVPGVEAHISGGQWGDFPALDGPAAISVVQALVTK